MPTHHVSLFEYPFLHNAVELFNLALVRRTALGSAIGVDNHLTAAIFDSRICFVQCVTRYTIIVRPGSQHTSFVARAARFLVGALQITVLTAFLTVTFLSMTLMM